MSHLLRKCSTARHLGACAVRRRVRGGLSRADDAVDNGRSRAEDLLGTGRSRAEDLIESIRPAVMRAINEAEGGVAVAVDRARAVGGEVLGSVPLPRRSRSRRIPAIVGIAALVAVGAALAAVLMRRRSASEPDPAQPPAAPAE